MQKWFFVLFWSIASTVISYNDQKNGHYQWDINNHNSLSFLFFLCFTFIHSFIFSLSLFTAEERQTKAMHLHLNDYRDTSKKKTVMMTVVAASTECAQHWTRKQAHNEEMR
jgi:hypothetical protein